MPRVFFAAIAITSLFSAPSLAGSITIGAGDTLSEIAEKHQVSLETLMRLNGIRDSNEINAGTILRLPGSEGLTSSRKKDHLVTSGENLSTIALKYGISPQELIDLNNLRDANYLYLGQRLALPPNITEKKVKSKRIVHSHVVKRGETLSSIAKDHNLSTEDLIAINKLSQPNILSPGEEISLGTKTNSSVLPLTQSGQGENTYNEYKRTNWKSYGPLKVNWSGWKPMNGSFYTPTLHKKGKAFYLAINCSSGRLNATGINGEWRSWISPEDEFEFKLIDDLCKAQNS